MLVTRTLKRLAVRAFPPLAVGVLTLVALDLLCTAFGLFPPTYDYGDPDLGWRAAPAHLDAVSYDQCRQLATGKIVKFLRNEDGIRTERSAAQILADRRRFKVAVTGDSQTDLCAPNPEVHPAVLERELTTHGVETIVLPYGVGRYSPLQSYLAYRTILGKYAPDAFVLNFYTGNDFNDLLRVDDRPHFVKVNDGYEVAAPVWYRFDDPHVRRTSRVRFLVEAALKRSGVGNFLLRLQFLHALAASEGQGLPTVLAYMNDLRNAMDPGIVYREAFAAQFLNQQLFFYRFPGSRAESINRLRALMALARKENPDTLLVMSALPSYQLVQEQPVDAALRRALARLPVSYEAGVRQEAEMYETLRGLAREYGWLFVDNLAVLRAYHGGERLYNNADYHLLPTASALIGKAQAAAILEHRHRPERRLRVASGS
jgi:hypothetical protein